MIGTSEKLDAEELLHLAINASEQGQPETAIGFLKRSIDLEPSNGKAMYMLGAMHAEIGMYERAIQEMQQATEIEPDLHTAHFQLGLLQLTSGNVDEAKQAWQKLDRLDAEHYLRIFKNGLLLLIEDKFDEASQALQRGILANQENLPLNNDMLKMINAIEKDKSQMASLQQSQQVPQENGSDEAQGQRILSAYQSDYNQ